MLKPDVIRVMVIVGIYLAGLLVPMMLSSAFFERRGKEIASAVCFMITGVVWTVPWVAGLIQFIPTGKAADIAGYGVLSAIGCAMIVFAIVMMIAEVKRRRKVAAETLF